MYLLGVGILLLVMKYMAFGPVADWSWWIVLSPFAMAVAWWAWADASGYTKRKAMEREDRRKQERIDRQRSQMGMLSSRSKGRRRPSR